MTPPPLPFFRGTSILAREADGFLRFRTPRGDAWIDPPGTTELLLPKDTIVHVHVEPRYREQAAELRFLGYFGAVSREPRVHLGPVAIDEAHALSEVLKARLSLPRLPVLCDAEELDDRLPPRAYVIATGEYRHTHGRADFGRVRLGGNVFHEIVQRGLPEGRYRAVGFYSRPEPPPGTPPVVGHGGPRLDVFDLVRA